MTDAEPGRLKRRNAELVRAVLDARARRAGGAISALELCSEDVAEAAQDKRLVRIALLSGATPAKLGPLFVKVIAELTYEVDWGDQFRFWPLLSRELDVSSFDLSASVELRRQVVEAFQVFAEEHGGAVPTGSFAAQFSLMSWPLVHALLPRCSQRHVARLFERAASAGLLPTDVDEPWSLEDLVTVATALELPLFVNALLENRSVLEPAGRALLGLERGSPPAWVRRLSGDLRKDKVAQDLLERAQITLRADRAATRRRRTEAIDLRLAIIEEDGLLTLWVEAEPLQRQSLPELDEVARAGAVLRTVVNKKVIDERPLSAALRQPLAVAVPVDDAPTTLALSARALTESVPRSVTEHFAGATRELKLPIVLLSAGAGRYVENTPHALARESGDFIVLALHNSPSGRKLAAAGLQAAPVRVNNLVALRGTGALATTLLAALDADANIASIALEPTLLPALRVDERVLTYPEGSDVWLLVRGAPLDEARAEVTPADAGDVALITASSGACLAHVRANRDLELRLIGRESGAGCRVSLRFEPLRQSGPAVRWRASLQPENSTARHVLAGMSWLKVEALPGVALRLALEVITEGRCARVSLVALDEDFATPLASSRLLSRLLQAAGLDADSPPPDELTLRAWGDDEPESSKVIAQLTRDEAGLTFELTPEGPRVRCEAGAVAIHRLAVAADGVQLTALGCEQLTAAGVYVASSEGQKAALCCVAGGGPLPRAVHVAPALRDVAQLEELVSLLRALDVAALWPREFHASALLARRSAVLAIEQAVVGAICGSAWLAGEQALMQSSDVPASLRELAQLAWLPSDIVANDLVEVEAEDDPFSVLQTLLEPLELASSEHEAARHLLMLFYRRSLASPRGDRDALQLAWASRQVARIARLTFLALPTAFHRTSSEAAQDV